MAAYNAKDYKTALPLLREWAKEVHSDQKQFTHVMRIIADVEMKTTGTIAAEGDMPATMATTASRPANRNAATEAAQTTPGPEDIDPSTNEARVPHAPIKPGEVRSLTIRKLGNFTFDPTKDDAVPPDVQALNGARVRLRGFIVPFNQADQITDFALVPSLAGCCFGQPPGVQHVIECRVPRERAIKYTMDQIVLEGTLKVNVRREDGYTSSIFELDVTHVK